MHNLSLFVN